MRPEGTSACSSTSSTSSSVVLAVHSPIDAIELLGALHAAVVVRERGIVGEVGAADGRIIRLKIESALAPITTYLPSLHG